MFIFRWILGILKTFFTVIILAVAIKLAFTYFPGLMPFDLVQEHVTAPGNAVPKSSTKNDAESKNNDGRTSNSGSNAEQGTASPSQTPADKSGKKAAASDSQKSDTSSKNPGEYFMTLNEVFAIENISLADKLAGLSILGKLKKDEVDAVFNIAEDGITYGELDEIRHRLEKSLPEKDVEKLSEILMKNKKLYEEGKLAK